MTHLSPDQREKINAALQHYAEDERWKGTTRTLAREALALLQSAQPVASEGDEALARDLLKYIHPYMQKSVTSGDAMHALHTILQAFATIRQQAREAIRAEALEEACEKVYGMCESDNVAQRTVNAIRALKSTATKEQP